MTNERYNYLRNCCKLGAIFLIFAMILAWGVQIFGNHTLLGALFLVATIFCAVTGTTLFAGSIIVKIMDDYKKQTKS